MSARTLARTLLASALAGSLATIALYVSAPRPPAPGEFGFPGYMAIFALTEAAIGFLVASRRPRNLIGWVFLGSAAVWGVNGVAHEFALRPGAGEPSSLHALAVWADAWLWAPSSGAVLFVLFRFPDGRPAGKRWRAIERLSFAFVAVAAAISALAPGPTLSNGLTNPYGLSALPASLAPIANAPAVPAALLAAASLVVRWRRSRDDVRQQLKWLAASVVVVAFAAVLLIAAEFTARELIKATQALMILTALLIPTSIGIAILRYRLFEIDAIIAKGVVYGTVTAILGGLFLGTEELLKRVFVATSGANSDLAVALSFVVVGTLFGPARDRVQAAVDRRLRGDETDGQVALSAVPQADVLAELRALRGEIAALRRDLRARDGDR